MKTLARIAFVSATMFAGAAMAADDWQGEMPSYPQDVNAVMLRADAARQARAQRPVEVVARNPIDRGEMPDYPRDQVVFTPDASRTAAAPRVTAAAPR